MDVSNLPIAAPDLEQRIVGGALRIGRIEQQRPAEPRPPAGRQPPVLALDVVDDRRARPGEQRRHDQSDALAGTGRREAQHMLRAVMAKIGASAAAEQNAVGIKEPRLADLARLGPACRAIKVVTLLTSRARHTDRATATVKDATPPAPAMKPPVTKMSWA